MDRCVAKSKGKIKNIVLRELSALPVRNYRRTPAGADLPVLKIKPFGRFVQSRSYVKQIVTPWYGGTRTLKWKRGRRMHCAYFRAIYNDIAIKNWSIDYAPASDHICNLRHSVLRKSRF